VRTKGRFARLGTALLATIGGLAGAYLLVVYVGGALLQAVIWVLVQLPRAFIWLIAALQDGADGWAIAGRVASGIANTFTTTEVAFSLIGLELVGAAALYGLQRLLRNEVRRTQSKEGEK
jgi:hypothetical protein